MEYPFGRLGPDRPIADNPSVGLRWIAVRLAAAVSLIGLMALSWSEHLCH